MADDRSLMDARLRSVRRRAMATEVRGRGGARAARPSSTRCRATPAATRRSWPSWRAGPAQHRRPHRAPPRPVLRAGPLEPPDRRRGDWPTCSSPTSSAGSTRNDYAGPGRPADRHIGPGSSRWPAAKAAHRHGTAWSSMRPRRRIAGPGPRSSPIARTGTGALEQVRAAGRRGRRGRPHRAQPRRQGRRPRLPPRDLLATGAFAEYDGSFRWGDQPNGTLQLLALDGRGRAARSGRARDGCRAAGLLPGVRRDRPASAGCSTASRRPWTGSVSTRRSEPACSSTNPARAFAFTSRDEEGEP